MFCDETCRNQSNLIINVFVSFAGGRLALRRAFTTLILPIQNFMIYSHCSSLWPLTNSLSAYRSMVEWIERLLLKR